MRPFLTLLLLSQPCVRLYGQLNYVREYRAKVSLPAGARPNASNSVVSTTYYDAAGRRVQTVRHGASPSGCDMADHTHYDGFGHVSEEWDFVPCPGRGGGYTGSAVLQSVTDYHRVSYGYDALGRPTRVTGANTPGSSSTVRYGYSPSGVTRYVCPGDGSVTNAGPYACALYSETRVDEDGGMLQVFLDSEGRTLLERRGREGNSPAPLDTYFVYDAFGSLACVLPPAAARATSSRGSYSCSNCAALRDYAYLYRYDTRNRRTGRKLPGQDWSFTVYDGEGRPILEQDPNLRSKGLWRFTRYNSLGQPTMEGTVRNAKPAPELSLEFLGRAVTDTYTGEGLGYGMPGDLGTIASIDKVYYYGHYGFLDLPALAGTGLTPMPCAPHDLSGMYQAILGDSSAYELRAIGYDHRGRVTSTTSRNTLCGTLEGTRTTYNALDLPTCVETTLSTGRETCGLTESVAYDPASRPLRSRLNVSLYAAGQLSPFDRSLPLYENTYDDYGRLTSSVLCRGVSRCQSYRADGKLSSITSPHFTQRLYYDDAVHGTRLHSGRISEVYTLQDGTASDFSIAYDAHWRYARGVDALHPQIYESFAYDAMGNVTELVHSTPDGLVNAVSLSYVGNRLSSAHAIPGKTASSSAKKQYPPMVYSASADKNAYLCDGNGNERRHLAHRVASSSYNMLNLPSDVTFTDKNSLKMKYTADGRRVETLSKTWLTPLVVPSDTLPAFDSTLTAPPLPAPSLAGASPQTLPTLPSGSIGGATLPGTIPGWQFGGGLTPNIPYSLHREWRIGRIVLEDSLITRIDIPDGHITVSRDGGGYGPLLCHRYVTDYLGSVRTAYLIHPVSGNSVPVQHIRYMPSGAVLGNTEPALQHRLFCGKELQPLHGWNVYDSHARMQYNVLPRFSSPDPLSEKYYHLSPYAYCANDPINMVDPEGKDVWLFATVLPMQPNIPKPLRKVLNHATHTFLVVKLQGKLHYFAYGPKDDFVLSSLYGTSTLERGEYDQDKRVFKEFFLEKHPIELKNSFHIKPPLNVTEEDFSKTVVDIAESYGNNPNFNYALFPNLMNQGNCNTSSSTILNKAGVDKEQLNTIEKSIKGINWGFNDFKAWTKEEQERIINLMKEKLFRTNTD